MRNGYKETPFDELEWWFATFRQEKSLGSPEEAAVIQNTLGKQVIVFDPQNAVRNFRKLTRDPTWGARLALAYHTVILRPRNRTQQHLRGLTQDSFFCYVAATLPYMQNVKELVLLDPNVDWSATTTKDLFEGTNMLLETLWCGSEALLARCWASLYTRAVATLQDFRGFCDPHQPPPSRIAPPRTPNLKYLETSAHFAFRLQAPWRITHLCIHVEWSGVPLILRKISNLPGLSDQLHSLRLNCYANTEQHPGVGNGTTTGVTSGPLAVQSPRMVCQNLHARVLNYLEIKEITPVSTLTNPQEADLHTIDVHQCDGASAKAFQSGFDVNNGTNTPSLRRIAWRPAWNEALSRQPGDKIKECIDAIFMTVLTVDFLAIALDRRNSGPWRVFTRDLDSGRIEDAERRHAIHEHSWKVTESENERAKRWHWPQSSQIHAQESLIP